MKLINLIVFVLVGIMGCGSNADLKDFDSAAWQSDEEGCNEVRLRLIDNLISQKENLYGLGQEGIKEVLGKPDRHDLYSRNKKAFTYFVSPGEGCETPSIKEVKLVVRFDGLGRAKEIVYYK